MANATWNARGPITAAPASPAFERPATPTFARAAAPPLARPAAPAFARLAPRAEVELTTATRFIELGGAGVENTAAHPFALP